MDQGTKALNKLLKEVETMSLEEYEKLYLKAFENLDLISDFNHILEKITVKYLQNKKTTKSVEYYKQSIDCSKVTFAGSEKMQKMEIKEISLVA